MDGDGDVRSNLLDDDDGGGTGEDTNVSHIHGGRPESLFISIYVSNVYDLKTRKDFFFGLVIVVLCCFMRYRKKCVVVIIIKKIVLLDLFVADFIIPS